MTRRRPKQYQPLAGKPMLWHAVRVLDVAPIEMMFVVLAKDDKRFTASTTGARSGDASSRCTAAVRRGANSVHNGLIAAMAAIDADDWVLVHDAARPCLPRADLERLIAECAGDAIGGILALPVADTVKRVAKDEAGVVRIAQQ